MRSQTLLLLALAAAALGVGLLFPRAGSATRLPPPPASPFLFALHVHSSLSEGPGTMTNHTREAEAAGFDGIWWTEHAERTMASLYLHRVRFANGLFADPLPDYPEPNGALELTESSPGLTTLTFPSTDSAEGASHLRLDFDAPNGANWHFAQLRYEGLRKLHKKSLMAAPHLRLLARDVNLQPHTGALVRAEFSSEPDGVSDDGVPYVIEYYVPGSDLPAPDASTVRLPINGWPASGWGALDFDLAADAATTWPSGPDMSLTGISLVAHGRRGGSVQIEVDDLRVELKGATDLALMQAQRDYLSANLEQLVRHEVGMEIGGPEHEAYPESQSPEHLTAFFADGIQELLYLTRDNPASYSYPASAVAWVKEREGAAILAHPFGTTPPPGTGSEPEARATAALIIAARAWGADGIEIGYTQRNRPLADHLALWDGLSEAGVFITGVGVTDAHGVLPWEQQVNRMGTWLHAAAAEPALLCDAIRGGKAFFGDPFRFDPAGDFMLDEAAGRFEMGDVVTLQGSRMQRFRARAQGAQSGWQFVLLHNGQEAARSPAFPNPAYQWSQSLTVAPGDWVRLELRDAADAAILFSNPIYFARLGQSVPEHRRP